MTDVIDGDDDTRAPYDDGGDDTLPCLRYPFPWRDGAISLLYEPFPMIDAIVVTCCRYVVDHWWLHLVMWCDDYGVFHRCLLWCLLRYSPPLMPLMMWCCSLRWCIYARCDLPDDTGRRWWRYGRAICWCRCPGTVDAMMIPCSLYRYLMIWYAVMMMMMKWWYGDTDCRYAVTIYRLPDDVVRWCPLPFVLEWRCYPVVMRWWCCCRAWWYLMPSMFSIAGEVLFVSSIPGAVLHWSFTTADVILIAFRLEKFLMITRTWCRVHCCSVHSLIDDMMMLFSTMQIYDDYNLIHLIYFIHWYIMTITTAGTVLMMWCRYWNFVDDAMMSVVVILMQYWYVCPYLIYLLWWEKWNAVFMISTFITAITFGMEVMIWYFIRCLFMLLIFGRPCHYDDCVYADNTTTDEGSVGSDRYDDDDDDWRWYSDDVCLLTFTRVRWCCADDILFCCCPDVIPVRYEVTEVTVTGDMEVLPLFGMMMNTYRCTEEDEVLLSLIHVAECPESHIAAHYWYMMTFVLLLSCWEKWLFEEEVMMMPLLLHLRWWCCYSCDVMMMKNVKKHYCWCYIRYYDTIYWWCRVRCRWRCCYVLIHFIWWLRLLLQWWWSTVMIPDDDDDDLMMPSCDTGCRKWCGTDDDDYVDYYGDILLLPYYDDDDDYWSLWRSDDTVFNLKWRNEKWWYVSEYSAHLRYQLPMTVVLILTGDTLLLLMMTWWWWWFIHLMMMMSGAGTNDDDVIRCSSCCSIAVTCWWYSFWMMMLFVDLWCIDVLCIWCDDTILTVSMSTVTSLPTWKCRPWWRREAWWWWNIDEMWYYSCYWPVRCLQMFRCILRYLMEMPALFCCHCDRWRCQRWFMSGDDAEVHSMIWLWWWWCCLWWLPDDCLWWWYWYIVHCDAYMSMSDDSMQKRESRDIVVLYDDIVDLLPVLMMICLVRWWRKR